MAYGYSRGLEEAIIHMAPRIQHISQLSVSIVEKVTSSASFNKPLLLLFLLIFPGLGRTTEMWIFTTDLPFDSENVHKNR